MSEVKTDKLSPRTDSGTTTLGDSGDTFLVNTGAKIDINGTELILDADADTSITSDTDDQIDIRIAGADDFQFTANTFTAAASSVVALDDGAVATPALTNTGDLNTGIYFPAADTVGVTAGGTEQFRFGSNPIPGGSKNMLINGGMAIAQRGSLTGQGGADFYTTCDRWKLDDTAGMQARYTTSQGTAGGVSGKDPWLSINVTTAESAVASTEKNGWNQFVEGNNARQLINSSGQLKASAVSFDVKFAKGGGSSLSAPYTMCVSLICEDNGYGWVEEISITADDTWEHKSFSIDALAQAASTVDTTSGYRLQFVMMAGTNYNDGSAGWQSSGTGAPATSNQDNLADATSNILGITNVQWEVGSVATDYAHEDIGTTLIKCQRYYEQMEPSGSGYNLPGTYNCFIATTSTGQGFFQWNVEKRAAPTIDMIAATDWIFVKTSGSNNYSGGEMTASAFTFSQIKTNHCWFLITTSSTGGTAGDSTWIQSTGANHKVTISAEL